MRKEEAMPPIDALHLRTMITEQLQNQTFRSILDHFADDTDNKYAGHEYSAIFARTHSAHQFANALKIAETYYLGADMQEFVQLAADADDFPADEAILREDLPSDAGIMYFPARFRMIEMRGRLMVAHAVVWLNNTVWWICDRRDPEDEMNAYLNEQLPHAQKILPRYDLMAIDTFAFGKPMPSNIFFPKGVLPPSAKVSFTTGPDGQIAMTTDHALGDPNKPMGSSEEISPTTRQSPSLRFLLTAWRIMQQTLASVEKVDDATKAHRRYALRAGIKDTSVSVISFRRRESQATGTGAPLTVRFPVRGHWAKRWCGTGTDKYLRSVYIHPYIKGPANAPLIHRERINALVR